MQARGTAICLLAFLPAVASAQTPVSIKSPTYVKPKIVNLAGTNVGVPTPATTPQPGVPGDSLFWELVPAKRSTPRIVPQGAAGSIMRIKEEPGVDAEPEPPKRPKPKAPLARSDQEGPAGQSWMEFDVTDYTARFSAADRPEDGVRFWLLQATGDVWHTGDLASLSVSAERVKVYHTPEVQAKAAAVLGRLLNFSPGVFRCRMRVVSTRDGGWRGDFARELEALPVDRPGFSAFRGPAEFADRFVQSTASGVGDAVLIDERFEAPNGQATRLDATAPREFVGRGSAANVGSEDRIRIADGLKVVVRPLIADGAGVDVHVEIVGRKLVDAPSMALDGNREPPTGDVPEIATTEFKATLRTPRGQMLIVSLGRGPSYDARAGLMKPKRPETLLVLEIAPDAGNTIAGAAVPPPPRNLVTPTPRVASSTSGTGSAAKTPPTRREKDSKNYSDLTGPRY